MNESVVSNLGSIASIIGLIFIFVNKGATHTIKVLISIVVILSCYTSYLIEKNTKYESAHYQRIANSFSKSMKERELSRQAKSLVGTLPVYTNSYKPGDNEGIIYITLRFMELHKEEFPELYARYKSNVLSDIVRPRRSVAPQTITAFSKIVLKQVFGSSRALPERMKTNN